MVIFEAFLKRSSTDYTGKLSFIKRDNLGAVIESESLRDIPILTGVKQYWSKSFDWQVGKGGIPEGKHYIWITNPNQEGQLNPTGGEVGQAYYISSSIKDKIQLINPKTKQVRTLIMIHPDNDKPGSIGCIVLPNTKQGRADFKRIIDFFQKAESLHVTHILLTVYR